MAKNFYETIIAHGGFAGQYFDLAQGIDVNQPGPNSSIIDNLLSISDGVLTIDAPVNLISTGALGAARSLDISNIEQEGRFFFLSVRNSDITVNNLTIYATGSINGFGPTSGFVISQSSDYIFVHESSGVWRAYLQKLNQSGGATIFRSSFSASDWSSGVANQITIVQTGVPGAGQIGPHGLSISDSYMVQAYRDTTNRIVDVGVEVNGVTGDITLYKTGLGANFDGRVIVIGD